MGFTINPRALAGLPPLLDRRAQELDSCGIYLLKEATIIDLGPLVATAPLARVHDEVVRAGQDACGARAEILRDRAAAVRAVITGYASSDAASAAALGGALAASEAAIPLGARQSPIPGVADESLGPDVFDAHWLVADQLRFPPDFRTEYPSTPQWTTPLSLSHLERVLLEHLGEFGGVAARIGDALTAEGAEERTAGDWTGCYASAYALISCRDGLHAVADDLRGAAATLGLVWTGRAAAACATALSGDAESLDRVGAAMTDLAAHYQPAAAAARDAATAVASLRSALADQASPAIGIGLSALTVGSLVEIGVRAEQRLTRAYAASRDAAHACEQIIGDLSARR